LTFWGSLFLRSISGTPHAEIIVVSDDKYDEMTPAEHVALLNATEIPEERFANDRIQGRHGKEKSA